MSLQLVGHVDLPPNIGEGGFDHSDVHSASDRLYVAHTSNNAVDVIDCARNRYVESLSGLTAVAGALVSMARRLVFTSNRGENTVSMFTPGAERDAVKITVGIKPNGLAFDPGRGALLAANVGDPSIAGSSTVSVVDIERKAVVAEITMPGRTRWAVYDPVRDVFYVNVADPAQIVTIDARNPSKIDSAIVVSAAGPHGLDIDSQAGRLYCACDAGVLFAIDAVTGQAVGEVALTGPPDVIFLQRETGRLYVAIGNPGVIDVIDARQMRRVQTIETEAGAHTLALDRKRGSVYSFLPQTHQAAIYLDKA